MLKERSVPGGYYASPGLENSVEFIVEMLQAAGVVANIAQVIDGNGIETVVVKYKPDVVVLEAIWCPPYKLQELVSLYPKIQWVVRVHSDIPFLASEGMAISWLQQYSKIAGVQLAVNKTEVEDSFEALGLNPIVLSNYYPTSFQPMTNAGATFKVGCFGAIRPLKNQLIQAVAAIDVAKALGRTLEFYMNVARTEQCGDPVAKNLQAALGSSLFVVPWLDRADFLELLKTMDLSLQVSFSETFNIVSADAVNVGIPMVVSKDISWADERTQVPAENYERIVETIEFVLGPKRDQIIDGSRARLVEHSDRAQKQWLGFLNG